MPPAAPLILASQSPRRAQLLRDAGFDFEQRSPPYADPDQPPDHLKVHEAEAYAVSLALKKVQSLGVLLVCHPATILAADTICVDDRGRLVGKPADRDHAEAMIRSFIGTTHRVITGVAVMSISEEPREPIEPFADTATVTFGRVTDAQLADYLDTDDWQGKAGGYNLFDRQAAGWPITVEGDPATVVGLPMRRLVPLLHASLNSGR